MGDKIYIIGDDGMPLGISEEELRYYEKRFKCKIDTYKSWGECYKYCVPNAGIALGGREYDY